MNTLNQIIKKGQLKKAEHIIRNETCRNSNEVSLLILLSYVLWNESKDQEALACSEKAIKISPNNLLLLYVRGKIFRSLEKYKDALDEWDKILQLKEWNIQNNGYGIKSANSIFNDSLFQKAICLWQLHKDKEALPYIKEHIVCRKRGIESDFTKKEAILFYKKLKYSQDSNSENYYNTGYATEYQKKRISNRMDFLIENKEWNKLIKYLKKVSKHYPKEYYLKTVISEYSKKTGNTEDCLRYAKDAFMEEPNDPLVKYDYAIALMVNGFKDEATKQFRDIVDWGIDYIAYSEHGEGLRWAKKIMRLTEKHLLELTQ